MPQDEVINDLKKIIAFRGVVGNKVLLIETLNFVDALICSKSKLQDYGKLSFNKDVNKKC